MKSPEEIPTRSVCFCLLISLRRSRCIQSFALIPHDAGRFGFPLLSSFLQCSTLISFVDRHSKKPFLHRISILIYFVACNSLLDVHILSPPLVEINISVDPNVYCRNIHGTYGCRILEETIIIGLSPWQCHGLPWVFMTVPCYRLDVALALLPGITPPWRGQ